jgi:signal transduction histidine kinase/CheY-like chemotaxis protein
MAHSCRAGLSTRRPEMFLSTKPVTVATPATSAVARDAGRAPAHAGPGPAPAPAPAPAGPAPRARSAGPWTLATPWLMGAVLVLAAWLAWFTVDLLQNRLHESSVKFDASAHRFERFWTLHDAAMEATLAVKWDLAAADPAPAAGGLQADALRFKQASTALQADIAQPGPLLLSQGPAWSGAVAALADSLALARVGTERAPALAQAQAVLAGLARIGQEARRRQAMAEAFLDEVETVRHQVLIAFSVIVAMLVLVVALAAQWVLVARRERASRGRAEHLAAVAETERARAETVARDKARFLGMLSHELLTPLQSIWSTMDVIESRGRVESSDPAFTRLKEATRSLRGRISDLVDFAKMSSGRLETRIRGFQLDKLVDTALRDVEEALAARNLDVHWEAGPELGQRIYSDPARLRQVIDNLLSNAIKYTERGGISIHAALLRDEGLLRVEISDTGVGIDPDEMSRLFEPFYRSPQTAGMAEGSGLGLAVVRSLVDLMGGSIRVDSRVGQGTAVTVEVPITEGADAAVDAPVRLDVRRPVLVVDDSRDARRAIADVIRALGVEVVEAVDGTTGLAAAAERDFQAIFLDMQMPDLTGYEVARRLRKPGDRHQKTFLVLISAYNDLDDATVDSVFDARIDKPASRTDLVAALGRAASETG